MTPKTKKVIAWSAGIIGAVFLLLLLARNRQSAVETVNENITPDGQDTGTFLSPMNYNIPPINFGDRGPTTNEGLTFISAPASAFACGKNTYYSSPEALLQSQSAQSAVAETEQYLIDLPINWNV